LNASPRERIAIKVIHERIEPRFALDSRSIRDASRSIRDASRSIHGA
jgi:hypothetical protein